MSEEKIKLGGGAEVIVDLSKKTWCGSCGGEIYWSRTKNGKSMPISKSDEWESHFATCPDAKKFRRKS